jgi:primosomal replication protein N
MDEARIQNKVELTGVMADRPAFSHESRGQRFYSFSLEICRLSGAFDKINIIARADLLESLTLEEADMIRVVGELRSFNNRSGEGRRLVITVFAREITLVRDAEWGNTVELFGTLCKPPNLRTTPMGREICDLMLAVNRRYGRSDYLPCIAWGLKAREASLWDVGTHVHLTGRIQSRAYIKNIDGVPIEKTAYEVSVIDLQEREEA